jgi:hypothetical protein
MTDSLSLACQLTGVRATLENVGALLRIEHNVSLTLLQSVKPNITDVLAESFVESVDGYWYPIEASDEHPALVRVIVAESGYCVERRARIASYWVPVATVPVAEFNPSAFRTWRRSWNCVA